MAAIWCWSVLVLLVCSVVENNVLALACFEMTPRNDIFILAGADLQINCTLNMSSTLPVCDHIKSNFDIHEVSIVKGSSDVPASLLVYNEAERTLTMNRPNVTVQDEGIYRCMYGNNRTVIHALKKVHVAESPSAPENLTCISKNTYDLRCYFTPSKKPVNIIMNWTMEYRLSVSDHSKVICSETSTLVYMCICPEDKQFYPERYQILIEGVNETFGIYVNKSFQVRLDATIVQPNPVQDLRIAKYNISDTITLLWSGPDGLVTGSETIFALDYKIVIMSDWDHRTEWINDTRDPDNTYNVSSLIAFSNYSITVQAKPTDAVGNIYWSDSRKVIFTTHSKISQHAVSVMPGSYILAECGSLVCPVLYWKNPDRKYWNGLITGYRIVIKLAQPETSTMDTRDGIENRNIVFHPEKRNIVYHIEKRNIANEPEYEHVEEIIGYTVSGVLTTKLLKDISYRVQMKLMNTEGVSGNYSEIIVPDWNTAQKFKPNWVSVQTAVGEPGSLISWNMNPTYCEDIVSVTYYWCVTDTEGPSNTSYFICKKNFDWVTVNITKQCGNETAQYITQLKNQSNVKYAVSLHTRDISGEMLWENLRFSVRKVPEMPLYQVSTEGTTLKIRIQYRGYHVSEFGKPEQYSVVYKECVESSDCKPGSSVGTVKKFPANFSNPVYNINNLKPGSKYQVYMKSENSYGSSVPGDPEMISITEGV